MTTQLKVTKTEATVKLTSTRSNRSVKAKASKTNDCAVVFAIADAQGNKKASMIVPNNMVRDLADNFDAFGEVKNVVNPEDTSVFTRSNVDTYRVVAKSRETDRYVAINKSKIDGKVVLSIGDRYGNKAAGFVMTKEALAEFLGKVTTQLTQ